MSIQCVLYCRDKQPVRLEIDVPATLRTTVGTDRLPAAIVVRAEELKLFGECAALFENRRKKNEGKGLSEYLLGKSKRIPFIDADYIDYGRLISGIDTLLQNAKDADEHGIYLLGVSGEHFQKIWSGSLPEDISLRPSSQGNDLAHVISSLPGEALLKRSFWGTTESYHLVR
jgi:hypothetical protein